MIELTNNPIDGNSVLDSVRSPRAGANLLFLGTTRQFTGDVETASLDYQAYPEMALSKLEEIRAEAVQRWELVGCAIVHRLGTVGLEEASVAVAVSSAHRAAAFEAGQWLLETLKQVVPIWKREEAPDGSQTWIHPDGPAPGNPTS